MSCEHSAPNCSSRRNHLMFSRRSALSSLVCLIAFAASLSAQAPVQTVPFDRANLDTTGKACQDFYQFANGGWLTRAKIPGDYPTYGAFDQLFDQNQAVLRNVLDTAVLKVKSGEHKAGTGGGQGGPRGGEGRGVFREVHGYRRD